ncbi:unnamed protein product [Symbiodinium sp. CCMP2456]|nr:unnamed protein product [Symbiodinium sp. CCMP2456]
MAAASDGIASVRDPAESAGCIGDANLDFIVDGSPRDPDSSSRPSSSLMAALVPGSFGLRNAKNRADDKRYAFLFWIGSLGSGATSASLAPTQARHRLLLCALRWPPAHGRTVSIVSNRARQPAFAGR